MDIAMLTDLMTKNKSAVDLGKQMPSNLKFGIIIAITIFWASFLRSVLNNIFSKIIETTSPILSDFIIASVATVIGYILLIGYRKIWCALKKIRIN